MEDAMARTVMEHTFTTVAALNGIFRSHVNAFYDLKMIGHALIAGLFAAALSPTPATEVYLDLGCDTGLTAGAVTEIVRCRGTLWVWLWWLERYGRIHLRFQNETNGFVSKAQVPPILIGR